MNLFAVHVVADMTDAAKACEQPVCDMEAQGTNDVGYRKATPAAANNLAGDSDVKSVPRAGVDTSEGGMLVITLWRGLKMPAPRRAGLASAPRDART